MIIRYTGNKEIKMVDVGGRIYTFNPSCEFNEVFDLPVIKWLLHPERKGLFIVEKKSDETPSKLHPEVNKKIDEKPDESEPKRRGRPPKNKD